MADLEYCSEKFGLAVDAILADASHQANLIAAYEAGLNNVAMTGTSGGAGTPMPLPLRDRIDALVERLSWVNAAGNDTDLVVYSIRADEVARMIDEVKSIQAELRTLLDQQ